MQPDVNKIVKGEISKGRIALINAIRLLLIKGFGVY